MPWFKVDDGFYDHLKIVALREQGPHWAEAIGLWTLAGSWASKQCTDGFVPESMIATFLIKKRAADYLVGAGLWEKVDGGFQFHDWSDCNPTRAELEAKRAETRERVNNFRRAKRAGNTDRNALHVEGRNTAPTQPNPSQPDPAEDPPNSPPRGATYPAAFVRFWEVYPKKVGKDAALRAWKKIKPEADAVMQALEWQRKSAAWRKEGGAFVPNPATYLNQGRWKDEPAAPARAAAAESKPVSREEREREKAEAKESMEKMWSSWT